MSNVLLTFLGRTPKTQGGYRTTQYDFGDGSIEPPTAFFGWALQRRRQPARLVILGTAGSMWDYLLSGDHAEALTDAQTLELMTAVEEKCVTPKQLAPLAPLLSAQLGCAVSLELIPYARNSAEQVELLRIMAAHVNENDRVDLDVTHGFRHLPMLAILAALHLRSVRRAAINGIWYGAFDPDTKEAPVHDLSGLLRIADWLQALNTYDKDGDYGVFAPLLGTSGNLLAEAAFFERTSNPVKAREKLTAWVLRENRVPADDPAAALFSDALHERIRWYRGNTRTEWEWALAELYLERQDYVRTAIYSLEACITAQIVAPPGEQAKFELRDQTSTALYQNNRDFKQLSWIRNALAHGAKPINDETCKLLGAQTSLEQALRQLLRALR